MRALCLSLAALCTRAAAAPPEVVFAREIGAILTRHGCNSSQCHGGVKGRGGLHLSPEFRRPREDYLWITRGGQYQVLTDAVKEPVVPRVNLEQPEKSLLLLKPTMSVPHGGGRRFATGSEEYRTFLEWIRAGAPYGKEMPAPASIEIEPKELFLPQGAVREVRALAIRAGGAREDVTRFVRFESNNPQVMRVSPGGLAEAAATGETSIVARGAGRVATALAATLGEDPTSFPHPAPHNFIDRYVLAKLGKLGISPSPPATHQEFLRRVCLDIAGTLPPPDRVREFLRDRDPEKRSKLITLLLDSPQYVDLWTWRFSDLFRVGEGPAERVHWNWVRERVAKNAPYDETVRERIASQGASGPTNHFGAGEATAMERAVAEEARVFLGRRMDCAQCHNHPYDSWTQDQFWGMAAFFGRMTYLNRTVEMVLFDDAAGNEIDLTSGEMRSPAFVKAEHPRTRKPVTPVFLDGSPVAQRFVNDPRLDLALRMTSHPYFAEAAVNRIWSFFFGRGLVQPVDDFREDNPPTHPGLLAALAQDFRSNGHDIRRLIRLIAESRTYQTSGAPLEANRADAINYSWSRPRALEAEVLLDAISSATAVAEVFRAPEGATRRAPGVRAIQLQCPAGWQSRFLQVYECPLRDAVPDRSGKPNLTQAMHLLAGSTVSAKVGAPGGRLDQLLARALPTRAIVEELYLAALTRLPAAEEIAAIEEKIGKRPDRRDALEDLLWGLIGSREFSTNH